ncbi:MAG: hypothetical protein PF517_04630 [Salinivirgaceae bacterium]|jgi:hypothetical protein|nr:hypothetical protein [Salinivirgaceae bacterium]
MIRRTLLYGFFIGFALSSCQTNKWDIDIADIKIDQEFKRFDQELFEIPHDSVWNYVPKFEKTYNGFFDLYNRAVIQIGGTNELDYAEKLVYFLTDPYISEAYTQINKTDYNEELATINKAFKRYHYYFADKPIPNIYTHISGFNQSLIIDSGLVSISLDKYLGADSKFYAMLRTPMYLRKNMHAQKMPSDVLYSWGLTEFPYSENTDNLSSQMIYYGKMHVFLEAMLPDTPDTLKWGYTKQKLEWCEKNERQMWLYLVENKSLFNSSFKEIKRFIDDGPFTTPFSKLSPPRTGHWIGYKIVNSYLKHHPNISLAELMAIDDYQNILNESKYKP